MFLLWFFLRRLRIRKERYTMLFKKRKMAEISSRQCIILRYI